MKKILKNKNYVLLFIVAMLKLSECMIDYDYYWQKAFGEEEFIHFNFSNLAKAVHWGSVGLTEYLDQEWITSVLYYLFSLLPFGIHITNFFFRFIFFMVSIKFIEIIKKSDLNITLDSLLCYIALFFVSLHVKAYTLVISLFMVELIMLYKFSTKSFKKYLILSSLLIILWNNVHSGTIVIYFATAFIYYIINFKNLKLKFLLIGLVNFLCLLVNPYGYRLLLFDLSHGSSSVMYKLGNEWQSLDIKVPIGAMIAFVIVILLIKLRGLDLKNKTNLFYFSLVIFVFLLCLVSVRHVIYFIPCFYYIDTNSDIRLNLDFFDNQFKNILIVVFSLVILVTTGVKIGTGSHSDYLVYFPEKLEKVIKDNGSEGLYLNLTVDFISVLPYDMKDFITSAYPCCSDRVDDAYVITDGCPDEYTKYVIDKYKLNKFLISKYDKSIPYTDGGFSNLYIYYNSHIGDYEVLYEDDEYLYFVKK